MSENGCKFRAVGFTKAAAEYPRDEMALAMFAAFNGVKVEQLPEGMRFFPNASMRDAWGRVANAARAFLSENSKVPLVEDRLRELAEGLRDCDQFLAAREVEELADDLADEQGSFSEAQPITSQAG